MVRNASRKKKSMKDPALKIQGLIRPVLYII